MQDGFAIERDRRQKAEQARDYAVAGRQKAEERLLGARDAQKGVPSAAEAHTCAGSSWWHCRVKSLSPAEPRRSSLQGHIPT